jgi:hypothetical protein
MTKQFSLSNNTSTIYNNTCILWTTQPGALANDSYISEIDLERALKDSNKVQSYRYFGETSDIRLLIVKLTHLFTSASSGA